MKSDLEITQRGGVKIVGADPQKVGDLCGELQRKGVSLCAVSEHRWKGEGSCAIGEDWLCVYSGLENPKKASQGVGFLLNKDMQYAWRRADELCEYGGGRLLRIRLKINGRFLSVISCYEPTFQCSEEEKEAFAQLGEMMDKVAPRDELIFMGDFNARVGIGDPDEAGNDGDGLREMVGRHGLAEVNENGTRLLDFCSGRDRDAPVVASTLFKHNVYGTWFHPSSRRWFQIDHVICRRRSLGLIHNVQVMPGYVHRTDHRFAKLTLSVPRKVALGRHFSRGTTGEITGRVPRLHVGKLGQAETCRNFNQQLREFAADGLFDDKYELFGNGMRKVACPCWGLYRPEMFRLGKWGMRNTLNSLVGTSGRQRHGHR